ncbi:MULTISPECIES: hypothetical protein [Halomonadaceae]|jgi:4-aminobutyrate aminotransferase / (S)-3-amino-2-methylpropionate transaminase / 5-aminovalerate transaminase|uniref:hypothetical protein n=1 Tax=Halomonadaceae TaxID=28256 RepID=UPI001F325C91|nr:MULTISPECIES: hypothetical protein [Halomonas]
MYCKIVHAKRMDKMLAERLVVREERFFAVAHGRQLGAMAGFELLDSEGKPEQRSPVRSVPKPARKA